MHRPIWLGTLCSSPDSSGLPHRGETPCSPLFWAATECRPYIDAEVRSAATGVEGKLAKEFIFCLTKYESWGIIAIAVGKSGVRW
jgi:hypothetical protein